MVGKRVLVAMSGGVDSSVAAALLIKQGYECIGATMQLWSDALPREDTESGCCSITAVEDARRVANTLGIPYYVFNMADEFTTAVVDTFAEAYLAGTTPNPCIVCNRDLKFGAFLRKACELECDYVATGHYARVWFDGEKQRYCLARGLDENKDQSYALHVLTQDQLAQALFPLGEMRKEETREIARRLGLRVAHKPDSQEICFVPRNDYRAFMQEYRPESHTPGPILNTSGRQIGTHNGISFYTVGQRKGLGVTSSEPLYVVEIDPDRNAVIVGSSGDVFQAWLSAGSVNWVSLPGINNTVEVTAKIRYHVTPAPALIEPGPDNTVITRFTEPQRAVTPGQSVVWYQGDTVVGGGVIMR